MTNVFARRTTSLNGKWQAMIDPTNIGNWRQVWKDPKALKKTKHIKNQNLNTFQTK